MLAPACGALVCLVLFRYKALTGEALPYMVFLFVLMVGWMDQ